MLKTRGIKIVIMFLFQPTTFSWCQKELCFGSFAIKSILPLTVTVWICVLSPSPQHSIVQHSYIQIIHKLEKSSFLFLFYDDCYLIYMKFSRHVYFAILRCAHFATLKFRDLAVILYFESLTSRFRLTQFISLAMLLKHVLEFSKPTLSKVQ